MHDGTRERYDPITLPSEVYLNKSVVSKTLAKLEADGILQRIQEAYYSIGVPRITFSWMIKI